MPFPGSPVRSRSRLSLSSAGADGAPPADLPDTLLLWAQQAPVALVRIEDDGEIVWVNPRFEAWTGFSAAQAQGARVHALLGEPLTTPWPRRAGDTLRRTLHARDGHALFCDIHSLPLPDGHWMLTLTDRGAEDALSHEIGRLGALLDFVQASARIGIWERDIRTLEGRWDLHMFRFWGLDPSHGTPSLPHAAQASVPQDQLLEVLTESLKRPGRHSHRYRMQERDGTVRRVQSHWEVKTTADGTPERVIGLEMDDTETYSFASTLDQANAQLQLATELADLATWRHDLASGRIHYNARAYQMLDIEPRPEGLTLEEVRSRIHPEDLSEVQASFDRALVSYHPEDMQARYRRRDGSWRHVLTRRVTQRDGRGHPIAFNGVALDITDQVERTRQTSELARQLEEVAAASGIGVWRVRRDQQGTEWNAQMYALFGLDPNQPVPRLNEWVDRSVHPDDRTRVRTQARAWMRAASAPAEISHRVLLPDGSVRFVVERGRIEPPDSPFQLTGVTIDVTERELALAALREATERSAMATRAAGIGIWEWNLDGGTARWDAQMFILRGLAPSSRTPGEAEINGYVHPEDREYVQEQTRRARLENRTAYYEFRVVLPDGRARWLASRSMPVRDDKGRTRLRLGVNWDITEARDAEEARQERALALRESRAKSELLARMSHELRTPMNAVLGFTHLLLADDPEPTSTRRTRLEHIRSAGEHLMTLINDVLELSRLDGSENPLVLQSMALGELIDKTLPMVESLARQGGVALEAAPTTLRVRADPTRLKQVLVNLLTNAIKYNRKGGSVSVSAAFEKGVSVLRVGDTGMGMTPQQCLQAFEPFNRVGAEREGIEGTGIGLTIVKALVERMGGSVSVRSTPGVGSVFEVRLAPPEQDADATAPPKRLLYIEDNPVNVLIVSELVRRRGDIEFDSMPDGLSGVRRAIEQPPEMVLIDMQLPDITGLEVLARLRADPATAGLPCIALSANAIAEDIAQALQAGFDDYWTKPLDFEVFKRRLDQIYGATPAPA